MGLRSRLGATKITVSSKGESMACLQVLLVEQAQCPRPANPRHKQIYRSPFVSAFGISDGHDENMNITRKPLKDWCATKEYYLASALHTLSILQEYRQIRRNCTLPCEMTTYETTLRHVKVSGSSSLNPDFPSSHSFPYNNDLYLSKHTTTFKVEHPVPIFNRVSFSFSTKQMGISQCLCTIYPTRSASARKSFFSTWKL